MVLKEQYHVYSLSVCVFLLLSSLVLCASDSTAVLTGFLVSHLLNKVLFQFDCLQGLLGERWKAQHRHIQAYLALNGCV